MSIVRVEYCRLRACRAALALRQGPGEERRVFSMNSKPVHVISGHDLHSFPLRQLPPRFLHTVLSAPQLAAEIEIVAALHLPSVKAARLTP